MSEGKAHADHGVRHVFGVMRLDFCDDDKIVIPRDEARWGCASEAGPSPAQVTGTRAYATIEEAAAEANRLNAMNEHTGARYFVTLLRLVSPPPEK